MSKAGDKIKVGITIGDPSGIGPFITTAALRKLKGLADFTVIGEKGVLEKARDAGHRAENYKFIDLKNIEHRHFRFGKVKPEYGKASIEYLDKALELIKNKEIDCLVTAPVSKESVNMAGVKFPGHTEYLARRTRATNVVMMLLNKTLKISLVTRHLPLKEIAGQLNKQKIRNTVSLTYQSLKKLFLINNPRLVVCGLNPHASDNGLIGSEENKIIKPTLKKIRSLIKHIDGPLPADTAILKTKQKQYDCVVAIYHDQALIPLKLSDSNSGVNLTLGLPFIRTSPLHGTAFDIAGDNALINPVPLVEAIKLAVKCASNLKSV